MKTLGLYLSPIDKASIKVFIPPYAEAESPLPFGGLSSRRITILKALNADLFDPKDFPGEDEQDWMMYENILASNEGQCTFHPEMRENIGKALYKTLFPPGSDTETTLKNIIFTTRQSRTQLHLQIGIKADVGRQARLFDYPWELLHNGGYFLTEHGIAISPYIEYEDPLPKLPTVKWMNVLLVSSRASDPGNGLELLSEEEHQAVFSALQKAEKEELIRLVEIKRATFESFEQYVMEHKGDDTPYVIHFDGHGHFGMLCNRTLPGRSKCKTFHSGIVATQCKQCGAKLPKPKGYLLFEDEAGKASYIGAEQIGATLDLANQSNETRRGMRLGIALVVLSACKSSLSQAEDSVFNGVAQNIISHRIPAVVGMSFSINASSAADFVEGFYRAVGARQPLAMAMIWGRNKMGC